MSSLPPDFSLLACRLNPKYLVPLQGVYILYKAGKAVYVGQSMDIHVRVNTHRNHKKIQFDIAQYFEVPPQELNQVERFLIRELDPEYNKAFKPEPEEISE